MASALLNWKEINLILSELELPGAVITRAFQPKHEIVIFELYKDREVSSLLFSFSPSLARMHGSTRIFSRPRKLQRFASFLAAHIRQGAIREAYQVDCERIVKLIVETKGERLIVWVRLWGGASNMIVTDEAFNVLDACYRRPGRNEVSGGYYNPEAGLSQKPGETKEGYEVRELPGAGTFNERVEQFFEKLSQESERESVTKALETLFHEREVRLRVSLKQAESKLGEYLGSERSKEIGDIITASIHEMKKGDSFLSATDFYNDSANVEIELDPRLSPQENAGAYYEKYKKAKAGIERIRESIESIHRALDALSKRKAEAGRDAPLVTLKETLSYLRKKETRERARSDFPGLSFVDSGYDILVGRTAAENDVLLRRYVRGNDFWFHARDYPGAYVFVRPKAGKSLPLEIMLDAGNIALFYSKAKLSGKGDVYYTRVKYLRRVRDGKKGLVIPTQEKNLAIVLDKERVERLKGTTDVRG